jgi:hypothetical protein
MGLLDILNQYTHPSPATAATSEAHFDQVANEVPPDELGRGVADAMRSDQTPPFSDMVSQLFGRSNPQQRAGLLNQMLASVGPQVLSAIAGGGLARVLGRGDASAAPARPQVTPEEASQVTPEQVREIAAHAEQHNPNVVDQVGGFFGQHPDLVKGLGGMALAVLLGKLANRR